MSQICECCGNAISSFALIKYHVTDLNGIEHPVCSDCSKIATRRGETMHYNPDLRRVVIGGIQEEIRKQCQVCGKVFC